MERKTDCENVVLSAYEKRLLKTISRKPHMPCDFSDVQDLIRMGLIEPDGFFNENSHEFAPRETYHVTKFYMVYQEYRRDRFRELSMQALWLPILVSFITTTAINLLGWLLPQIIG